mmetsp:Transcript_70133/g.109703  ORF Transcript_70133/g.109703 Transcript_70133/m.109703 type:complete len:81 (+) Transcript_70133:106-348(+)
MQNLAQSNRKEKAVYIQEIDSGLPEGISGVSGAIIGNASGSTPLKQLRSTNMKAVLVSNMSTKTGCPNAAHIALECNCRK